MFTRKVVLAFLLLLALMLAAVGCGATPAATPDAGEGTSSEHESSSVQESEPSPEATLSTEGEEASADVRAIKHEMGVREITGTPTRIVALEWRYVEDLLALGIQPVGVADAQGYREVATIEPALAEEVADVGTRQEPNLEVLAALEPDLIIGARFRHEAIYEELESIAPTLLYNYTDVPQDGPSQLDYMIEEFRAIADATNRQAEGESVLAEMETAFEAAATAVEAAGLKDTPVVLAQFLSGSPQLRLWSDYSVAIQGLEKSGLVNGWEGEFDRFGFNVVEYEALPEIGQANVFTIRPPGNPPANPYFDQLQGSDIWTELDFVKEDRFYELSGVWPFGGPLTLPQFTHAVVEALTGEPVATATE